MKTIIIDINHPAHVHFFKHVCFELKKQGHNVIVTASLKEMNYSLLDRLEIDFIDLGSYGNSPLMKMMNVPVMAIKMARIIKKHKPEILMGIASSRICHGSFFQKCKTYVFTDTEHAKEQILLFKPFATKIFTPDCFEKNLGKKHVRYPSYHELAYLHPNRFKPDPTILDEADLSNTTRFFVLRFVSWNASHDIGQKGITKEKKFELFNLLRNYGKVFISSEAELPPELESYRLKTSFEKIHHLLYFASLVVTEGATMASESALLGTPVIYVNSLTLGYLQDLANHKLVHDIKPNSDLIDKVKVFVKKALMKDRQKKHLTHLINKKIDLTDYIVNLV